MDLGGSRKRKHGEPDSPVTNGTDHDIEFLAKIEPPEIKRNRLLKVLVGDYFQFSSRGAVQDILTDPASFHCDQNLNGDTCRIIIPQHIDSYATHVVLQAALNPEIPLNCNSSANGLTLNKLHDVVKFLKLDGNKIGLEPLPGIDNSKVAAIQVEFHLKFNAGELWQLSFAELLQVIRKDFLAVPCELDVYKVIKKWCDHDAVSRMTKENLSALLVEIRWELLADMLEALVINADGPLLEMLSEIQRYFAPKPRLTVERRFPERGLAEDVFVFYADRNQAELKQFNWETNYYWDIPLPYPIQPWCRYKEMGPAIDGERVLLRASSGKYLETWSFSVVTKEVRSLFKQEIKDGTQYPLAYISGAIYAWDFLTKGQGNRSFKFDAENTVKKYKLGQPEQFREEAAFDACSGKFYYCGGTNLAGSQETVSTVEVYDAAANKWTKLPNMREPRRCFAAKVYDGYLYVTGGAWNWGLTGVLHSCERLNLALPAAGWERIGFLNGARYDHCMVISKGQLYVCGGLTSSGTLRAKQPSQERYNPQLHRWDKVNESIRWPATSCATFVLSHK